MNNELEWAIRLGLWERVELCTDSGNARLNCNFGVYYLELSGGSYINLTEHVKLPLNWQHKQRIEQ